MISFDLNFFPRPESRGEEPDNFENLLETWLASLLRNGNIIDDWQVLELSDRIQVRVEGIAPNALAEVNWGDSAKHDWEKLQELLLAPSDFHRVGKLPSEPTWCECMAGSCYLLFAKYLHGGSPVQCLECGGDIPLYRLPVANTNVDRSTYRFWQSNYNALDQLWMASGVGERFAYRQLARPKSDFMKETRELAAKLEAASQIPTYSFLLHHHKKWGKHCPLCKRKWRWKKTPNMLFAFKCDHCRLVSSEASGEALPLRKLHP